MKVDREKLELHYFPQDPLTSRIDCIKRDTARGGSRVGLWGGHLIHFIVFSCGKFLRTIVCYREYYCLRKHGPVASLDRGSGYEYLREKQGRLCVIHIYAQFSIEVGHSELENSTIYSFSLWCS